MRNPQPVTLEVARGVCRAVLDRDGQGLARVGQSWTEAQWEAAGLAATQHGVAQLLEGELAGVELPAGAEPFRRHCSEQTRLNRLRFELQRRECLRAVTAVREAGVEVLVLKGLIHAHLLHPDPARRPMTDTDLLVPPEGFPAAARAIAAAGFQGVNRTEKHLVFCPPGNRDYPHRWSDHPENRRAIELHDRLRFQPFQIPVRLAGNPWSRAELYPVGSERLLGLGLLDALATTALGIADDLRIQRFRLIKLLDVMGLVERLPAGTDAAAELRALGPRVARFAYPALALAAEFRRAHPCAELAHRLEPDAGPGLRRLLSEPDLWHRRSHACPMPVHGTVLPCLAVARGPAEAVAVLRTTFRPPLEYADLDPTSPGRRRWGGYLLGKLCNVRSRWGSRISPGS